MTTAIDTKDRLLTMVGEGRYDEVIAVLHHTVGLWQELGYAYKGAEIAQWIIDEIVDKISAGSMHYRVKEKFNDIQIQCYMLIQVYNAAQALYCER